jgi:homogentisate 1,2-dioxygenase
MTKKTAVAASIDYQSGFANHFASEAEPGALPVGQNSPQAVPHDLYAELLSGTSFTTRRAENQRSWLYRIRPSVVHGAYSERSHSLFLSRPFQANATPEQMRWSPIDVPDQPLDFLDGVVTIAGNGDLASIRGCAVHIYRANRSMEKRFFLNADGEMLIVPEMGSLHLRTEFGAMHVAPGEIAVVPTGVKFQALLLTDSARGYICENYGPAFRLPELGPIGANGLANPRDFLIPKASYEEKSGDFELWTKFQGKFFSAKLSHSPLDVVAWHGNYAPYKYDLSRFQVVNTVSFDHCDPSIYTVLTSPSEYPGLANVDFVIFPPRWSVAEHTFRPAWFHRNCMSEYMGLISGAYEAKQGGGFVPGGGSLHNRMSAHGPDSQTYEQAVKAKLTPAKIEATMAFMFESSLILQPTAFALNTSHRQSDYRDCWQGLKANFKIK